VFLKQPAADVVEYEARDVGGQQGQSGGYVLRLLTRLNAAAAQAKSGYIARVVHSYQCILQARKVSCWARAAIAELFCMFFWQNNMHVACGSNNVQPPSAAPPPACQAQALPHQNMRLK
jgi:hypothetical protein